MAYDYMTLAELAKGTGSPDITAVVDEITQATTMLGDAAFTEATGMLENQGMRKLTLPTNEWVAIDQGGKVSKGHKELFKDEMGIIESWASARQKEGMFAPNPEKVYAEDEKDHVASMGLDIEECLIYGGSEVGQFKGLAPRFNKVLSDAELSAIRSTPKFITLSNAGNTDDKQSSMYFIVWGDGATQMLYPRYASNRGITITKGQWQVIEENGEKFFQRDTQFLMSTGLSLMNRFAVIRIANIDVSSDTSMGKLKSNMYKAFTLLPKQFKSRVRIYAPGAVVAAMNDYYSNQVSPVVYQGAIPQNAIGDVMFDRFVIRQCDSLISTEDVVA